MMWFWLGALILVAIVILPFLMIARRPKQLAAGISQLELNKQVFEQRLQELEQQRTQGELTDEEYGQLQLELQTNLLDDTAEMSSEQSNDGSMKPLWGLVTVAIIAVIALYAAMGNYQKVEQWQQSMEAMPELAQRLMQPGDNPLSSDELEQFALALRTKLHENGDDAMGWLLFGRIQLSFGRLSEATEAFTNALHLEPNNRSVNLSYAKALAMSGEPAKVNYAKSIYQRLLADAPNDLDILSEQAFTLFELGDREEAFAAWQKMLAIIPADTPRHQQIVQTIAMLKAQQAGTASAGPMANPHAPSAPQAKPNEQTPTTATEPSDNNLRIKVTVEAGGQLAIPQGAYLVVYARAVQGPPMPMAVKRMTMPELPLQVELTSADAMMANYQLGAVEPFEVVVKVVGEANVATADSLYQAVSGKLSKQDLPTNVNLTLQAD